MTENPILLKYLMNIVGIQDHVNPVVDLSAEKIVQFGLVVKDVEKVVTHFSEVFDMSPWRFYDFRIVDRFLAGMKAGK